MRGRLYPGLGISRSFGDYIAHRIGAKSEPTICSPITIKHNNECVVIANSTLWNVMTPKEVFESIKMNQHKGLGQSSKILAAKAKELYICSKNLMPDITIIIQYLNSANHKYN